MLSAASAAEAAAQSAATAQGLSGIASQAETGQLGAGSLISAGGALLASQAGAQQMLLALGLFGPFPGTSPAAAAANMQYANLTNGLVRQLAGIASVQALLGIGASAMLANSGRRFLLSTYYGIF